MFAIEEIDLMLDRLAAVRSLKQLKEHGIDLEPYHTIDIEYGWGVGMEGLYIRAVQDILKKMDPEAIVFKVDKYELDDELEQREKVKSEYEPWIPYYMEFNRELSPKTYVGESLLFFKSEQSRKIVNANRYSDWRVFYIGKDVAMIGYDYIDYDMFDDFIDLLSRQKEK